MRFASNLESDTEALAQASGRRHGTSGHAAARAFALERLREIGLTPFVGDQLAIGYSSGADEFCNLAGVVRGSEPEARPLLIGANYDSAIKAPCADDNATSVAVALAMAEHLAAGGRPRRDVVIALFDAGAPPHGDTDAMGVKRLLADHCGAIEFACAILLDRVGHDVQIQHPAAAMMPALKRLLFVLGSECDAAFPEAVGWAAGEAKGLKVFPTLSRYLPTSPAGEHGYWDKGRPLLYLSCGEGEHHGKEGDRVEWVNFEKLRHVAAFVADVVTRLQQGETAGEACDPVDFEIRMIKKVVGLGYPMLLKALGLQPLKAREDIDALAELITKRLGGDQSEV